MRCASIGLIFLAGACFVIGAIAVAIPFWGHFRNRVIQETGHFGPWTICKDIDYGRKMCGPRLVMFKPGFVVYAAGVCSAVGVAALGGFGLMTILYMTVQCSPQSSLRPHKVHILISQLVLSLSAALMTWTAVGIFATQGDDLENGYIISVGFSFYMEIVVGLFSTILMLLTIGEYVTARREPDEMPSPRTEIGMKHVITNTSAVSHAGGGGRSNGSRNGPTDTRSAMVYKTSSIPDYIGCKFCRGEDENRDHEEPLLQLQDSGHYRYHRHSRHPNIIPQFVFVEGSGNVPNQEQDARQYQEDQPPRLATAEILTPRTRKRLALLNMKLT